MTRVKALINFYDIKEMVMRDCGEEWEVSEERAEELANNKVFGKLAEKVPSPAEEAPKKPSPKRKKD